MHDRTELILDNAGTSFPLLAALAEKIGKHIPCIPIETLYPNNCEANKLASLFESYGSDKSTHHNYHLLYGPLLRKIEPSRFLEIGLGTNYTDVLSNMGETGKPGASLRAFRDFLPKASIFGADIDKRVLFTEERIKTFYVDQTSPDSFTQLSKHMGSEPFDVVIDDGLHSPNANLATMLFAMSILKPSGLFVVEDFRAINVPIWQTVVAMFPANCNPMIIEAANGFLFVVRKP